MMPTVRRVALVVAPALTYTQADGADAALVSACCGDTLRTDGDDAHATSAQCVACERIYDQDALAAQVVGLEDLHVAVAEYAGALRDWLCGATWWACAGDVGATRAVA